MTLVLIMASGESLLETGVRLKTVKPKKDPGGDFGSGVLVRQY
jgi:hypothetical protein